VSDLERLFRLCGSGPKPLENFTSAALAIAIGHDDGPIKQAMRSLRTDGCCKDEIRSLGKLAELASKPDTRVTAITQVRLTAKDDIPMGYLDLVLTFKSPTGEPLETWVEVKVDAWESGRQLDVYRRHAALRQPKPVVITLGRSRVRSDTAHLNWTDAVEACRGSSSPHYTWQSLGEFLAEQWVVTPPLPLEPIDNPIPYLNVIVGVNGRVRALWPNAGLGLAWKQDARLRSVLEQEFAKRHCLLAKGGPLHYGLMPTGEGWAWFLNVSTNNDDRIELRPEDLLPDATGGDLPGKWIRPGDRSNVVLSKQLPLDTAAVELDVLKWFDESLQQLRDAKILERYLARFEAKRRRALAKARSTGRGSES